MLKANPFRKPSWPVAYSFALVTTVLFLLSWVGQLFFQALEFRDDAYQHGQVPEWAQFWPAFFGATFENWQSEFLQLVWQVAGLALFYHWGSSQSREGDARIEAKLDALLIDRGLDPGGRGE